MIQCKNYKKIICIMLLFFISFCSVACNKNAQYRLSSDDMFAVYFECKEASLSDKDLFIIEDREDLQKAYKKYDGLYRLPYFGSVLELYSFDRYTYFVNIICTREKLNTITLNGIDINKDTNWVNTDFKVDYCSEEEVKYWVLYWIVEKDRLKRFDFSKQKEEIYDLAIDLSVTPEPEKKKYYSAEGKELQVDMSFFSPDAKLLTTDDIYIENLRNIYFSRKRGYRLVIQDEEQLQRAKMDYGLGYSGVDPEWNDDYYFDQLISSFENMANSYPLSDFDYIIEYYVAYDNAWAIENAQALLVDKDWLNFVFLRSDREYSDTVTCDVDGIVYMAAIPKGTLMNDNYKNWIYP